MAVLRELNGNREFPLWGQRTVVGRAADCDIVLNVPSVSAHHAEIVFSDGAYQVQDLGSTNGTLVNGQRIQGEHATRPER
jgi:pSer/pThr/pTyr-binding forkhead associated (FHA) protein